jgi:uncharacterized phage protein gp47/JayE
MPTDIFDGKFVTKNREEVRNDWLKDYQFRSPESAVGPDTLVWVDASTAADAAMPLYFDVKLAASIVDIDNATGDRLDIIGDADGVPRLPASTAQGSVRATAAAGGGEVIQGAKLRHQQKQTVYQVLVTKTLTSSDLTFAIASVGTGAEVNLAASAVLQWENPPVGLGSLVTVIGNGIQGGGPEEDNDSYRSRIKDARQNPAAAANCAHYTKTVEAISSNVEKAFCIPAIRGPGTVAIAFTVKPDAPGGERKPNGAQIATVEIGTMDDEGMPVDDSALFCALADHDVDIALRIKWNPDAPGWVDTAPWPVASSPAVRVDDGVAIAATAFRVVAASSTTAPSVGKTIALWNPTAKKMVAKRITGVSVVIAGTSWDLTLDSESPTSDVAFTPVDGQRVSPWADSANEIAPLILAYMDKQGPGEQVASLPDANGRQARFPLSPKSWPSVVTGRILDGVFDLETLVTDAEVLEPSLPFPTTVGTPGVLSYLHRLDDLSMFSQE